MGKKLFNIIRIVLTLLFLYFVFRKIEFSLLKDAFISSDKIMLIWAFILFMVNTVLMTLRISTLFKVFPQKLSFLKVLRYYLIGIFFNQALPTAVGGDAVKGYKLGKAVNDVPSGLLITFIDRLLGLLTMLAYLFVAILIGGASYLKGNSLYLLSGFAAICIVLTIMIFSTRLSGMVYRIFFKPFEDKVKFLHRIKESYRFFLKTRDQKKLYYIALVYSFAAQLILIVAVSLLAAGLGITLTLEVYFIVMPIIFVISMIPISVGGFGVREQAFVSLLALYGIGRIPALALALLYVGLYILMCIPGGVLYLFGEKEKIDG
ncbi:flippase-like domain-containing protein [bacterium]|nr:flippase-like domain-containing protein [bacterium]